MLNQTLTTEQIEAMKEANMGGDEIVTALLANSGTFETKTEYSQVATLIQSPKHARVTIISRQGVGLMPGCAIVGIMWPLPVTALQSSIFPLQTFDLAGASHG